MKKTGAFTLGFLAQRKYIPLALAVIFMIGLFVIYAVAAPLLGMYDDAQASGIQGTETNNN